MELPVRLSMADWDIPEAAREALRIIRQAVETPLAVAVFAADLLLILLHGGVVSGWLAADERLFRINFDGGVAESFGYAKLVASAALVFYLSARRRLYPVMPMALAIVYLCLDDAFRLHERMGEVLVPAHDNAGEALYMMAVGGVIVAMAAVGYMRSHHIGRVLILAVLVPILLLGAFGTGVDALQELVVRFMPASDEHWKLLEDGGEMVSMSLLLLTSVWLVRTGSPFPAGKGAR
jgi:hypothetical protein